MDFMEVVRRSRVEGVSLQAAREGDIIVGGTLVVTAYILHQEIAGEDELIVGLILLHRPLKWEVRPGIKAM